jgi:hypothetical protein
MFGLKLENYLKADLNVCFVQHTFYPCSWCVQNMKTLLLILKELWTGREILEEWNYWKLPRFGLKFSFSSKFFMYAKYESFLINVKSFRPEGKYLNSKIIENDLNLSY